MPMLPKCPLLAISPPMLVSPNPMEPTPAKHKRSRLFPNSIVGVEKTPPGTDRRSLAKGGATFGSSEVNAGG